MFFLNGYNALVWQWWQWIWEYVIEGEDQK
jgi:hypothetical protein